MTTECIAIANQKGGVGKTTTSQSLGVSLATYGKKVLIIDSDPQGSLTISLGYPNPDQITVTLSDLLNNKINDETTAQETGIIHHPEGIDFITPNIELAGLEASLFNIMNREKILKLYIDQVKSAYDYILIDCLCALAHKQSNAE